MTPVRTKYAAGGSTRNSCEHDGDNDGGGNCGGWYAANCWPRRFGPSTHGSTSSSPSTAATVRSATVGRATTLDRLLTTFPSVRALINQNNNRQIPLIHEATLRRNDREGHDGLRAAGACLVGLRVSPFSSCPPHIETRFDLIIDDSVSIRVVIFEELYLGASDATFVFRIQQSADPSGICVHPLAT